MWIPALSGFGMPYYHSHSRQHAVCLPVSDGVFTFQAQCLGNVAQDEFPIPVRYSYGRVRLGVQHDVMPVCHLAGKAYLPGADCGKRHLYCRDGRTSYPLHGSYVSEPDVYADARLTPGGSSSLFSRENLDVHNDTGFAMGYTQRRIADFPFLVAENSARSRSSAVSSVSPFGVTFTDEDVSGLTSAPTMMIPPSSRFFTRVITDIRDVTGDFFGTQFGIAGVASHILQCG